MTKPTFDDALTMLREGWRWSSATEAAIMADALERELGYEGEEPKP